MQTFLWHDYETFGADPRRDRPAQFAAVRTDAELNETGDVVELFCQPTPDFVPDVQACLITGITPQTCLERGMPEHAFARGVEAALAQPQTIGVGYNSIRFDDEVTRFLLWRNLIDPYAREWQNGCGRWDLLDVVRTAYALRPEGIEWPKHEDGRASFRLEHLTAANGITHEAAHDALSDVRATIALARLLRQRQPRLFDFCLSLHRKEKVAAEMGLPTTPQTAKPFLHVSGMFGPERGCLAVMWPLASHPVNRNEVIAWDLAQDPRVLADLSAADIRERLFTRADALPEGITRLPIKTIHLNRAPIVIGNCRTLTPAQAERWGVDQAAIDRHAAWAQALPDLSAVWAQVLRKPEAGGPARDVDSDLYGALVGNADRRRLQRLRELSPPELALDRTGFDDERLTELVWRYRARNFPQSLSAAEVERWQRFCQSRVVDGADGARTAAQLLEQADVLFESADERQAAILEALVDYASALA